MYVALYNHLFLHKRVIVTHTLNQLLKNSYYIHLIIATPHGLLKAPPYANSRVEDGGPRRPRSPATTTGLPVGPCDSTTAVMLRDPEEPLRSPRSTLAALCAGASSPRPPLPRSCSPHAAALVHWPRLSVGLRVFRLELCDRGGSDLFRISVELIPPYSRSPTASAGPWA